MFTELLPILRDRPVMLTIALVNDQAIRVNVIPKRSKEGDSGDCSLTTPLTITGTPEELDREFSGQLVAFTGSFVRLGSNLSEIEAAHATAVKAVEAERKRAREQAQGCGLKADYDGPRGDSGTRNQGRQTRIRQQDGDCDART